MLKEAIDRRRLQTLCVVFQVFLVINLMTKGVGSLKAESGQALVEYIIISCMLTLCLLGASGSLENAWDKFYQWTSGVLSLPFF